MHNGCTNQQDPDGKFWCSTKTDEEHNHVGNEGNFGFCPDECKKSDGKPKGMIYYNSRSKPPW